MQKKERKIKIMRTEMTIKVLLKGTYTQNKPYFIYAFLEDSHKQINRYKIKNN